MKMPVDIAAVLKAATDVDAAAKTPLSISLYIANDAPAELVAHVRHVFASESPYTRVTMDYVSTPDITPHKGNDMAIIVAADGATAGQLAAVLRESDIATMVVTLDGNTLGAEAAAAGYPIAPADIAEPEEEHGVGPISIKIPRKVAETDVDEPSDCVLSSNDKRLLNERMGRWIIAACADRKLAFALAFPFVRRPLAQDTINATALQNAGIGLVPFIPGADMPIMTLNQIKMLLKIAAAYGQPMDKGRLTELGAAVAGAFVLRNVARTAAGIIPILGAPIKGCVGFAGTEAMGRAALEYFEAGGDITGVASVIQHARDAALDTSQALAKNPTVGRALISGKQLATKALAALAEPRDVRS